MGNNVVRLLINQLETSLANTHKDNYDEYRYGRRSLSDLIKEELKSTLFRNFLTRRYSEKILTESCEIIYEYSDRMQRVYEILGDKSSKELFVKLIAHKILGREKVKLPINNSKYWSRISEAESIRNTQAFIETDFNDWKLYHFNLNKIGYPIELMSRVPIIVAQLMLEQYRYKDIIRAERGDVVIDAGACWGDSTLYFANRVGEDGKVYSFEFIPANINIMLNNLKMNNNMKDIIHLIRNPLWDEDNTMMYYRDYGPASRVSLEPIEPCNGTVVTKTIDTFCAESECASLDFIKMDIEGAEPNALEGAIESIKKYKPKLAIASYHSIDDFINIPIWIEDLDIDYNIYIDHFTIHWEETVVFANPVANE